VVERCSPISSGKWVLNLRGAEARRGFIILREQYNTRVELPRSGGIARIRKEIAL
jgi:hypothetical protein